MRRRARRARGASARRRRRRQPPSISDAPRRRSLVDFVALDGRLLAVTVVDGRARLRELGDAAAIEREVESLRMGLRSLATAPAGSRAAAAMGDVCDAVARKLDALLFGPLAARRRAARARADRRAARAALVDAPVARAPAAHDRAVAAALAPHGDGATAEDPPAGARRRPAAARRDRGDRDAQPPPSGGAHADRRRGHRRGTSPARSTAPPRCTSPRTARSASTTRSSRASSSPTGASPSTTSSG